MLLLYAVATYNGFIPTQRIIFQFTVFQTTLTFMLVESLSKYYVLSYFRIVSIFNSGLSVNKLYAVHHALHHIDSETCHTCRRTYARKKAIYQSKRWISPQWKMSTSAITFVYLSAYAMHQMKNVMEMNVVYLHPLLNKRHAIFPESGNPFTKCFWNFGLYVKCVDNLEKN